VTHALAGAAVQIAALTVLVFLVARWWARRGDGDPPRWSVIAVAITACVLSHLYMDWQGSYGWRPFLPWNGAWYYGDLVAIVDPFFWLVPLIALAWGAPRQWREALGYGAPAAVLVSVVFVVPSVAPWVKIAAAGLVLAGGFGWVSHWWGSTGRRRVAAYAIATLTLYAGAHALAGLPARGRARSAAAERFGPGATSAVLTVPGQPFTWEPVVASGDTVAGPDWEVPRRLDEPVVQRALATTRAGRSMAGFARFLTAELDTTARDVTVVLRDARYAREGDTGWGVLTVTLRTDPPS
jgi:hypothetical protein